MAIVSSAVSVTPVGTTIFAPDPGYFAGEIVYVMNNTGTACFIGGGTSLATGGGTTAGFPVTSANLAIPIRAGLTDRLFGITATGGTADIRVLIFTPSR